MQGALAYLSAAIGPAKVGMFVRRWLEIARQRLECVQLAGAFAVVLECIPADVAASITEELKIPTIGIGAGPYCDGQVLVSYDAFGLFDEFQPSFVKRYARMAEEMETAARQYIADVQEGRFPAAENSVERVSDKAQ